VFGVHGQMPNKWQLNEIEVIAPSVVRGDACLGEADSWSRSSLGNLLLDGERAPLDRETFVRGRSTLSWPGKHLGGTQLGGEKHGGAVPFAVGRG
jgi:hypothetical protein